MPRFSLSPVPFSDSSSDVENSYPAEDSLITAKNEDARRQMYDDDEEEEPHPLGFSTTRFSLDGQSESLEHYKRRWGYVYPFETDEDMMDNDITLERQQQYPPISQYLDPETAPTSALLQVPTERGDATTTMDRLASLLEAASIVDTSSALSSSGMLALTNSATVRSVFSPQDEARTQQRIQREMDVHRKQVEQENLQAAKILAKLISREEYKAEQVRNAQEEQERQVVREKERQEQKVVAERKAQETKEQQDQEAAQAEKDRADQKLQEKQRMQAEKLAKKQKENEYLLRAKKLVAQLVQVRASVEPFEKSKPMAKRRLGMKKIVNGRVNTLAENADKIRQVASEVSDAIAKARAEDGQMKQQLQQGVPNLSSEMARGKRYLVDLLSSKVIVRVQAEGFNGQRGDGFPLANMLALVSTNHKDLNPVLMAHIYTVCPLAVPTLPTASENASEDEFMESLGMLKLKDGSFETFERFLSRTEGIISIVANIMASQPPDHTLLDGHEGAIKWLSRFLALLPAAPQSPLPLPTAPVLDAFLTGAGHMMANVHSEEFKKHLDVIANDIVNRLDESSVGKPSCIRLKKTIEGGFEKFKTTMPSRALSALYYGGGGSSGPANLSTTSSSPFAASGTTGGPSGAKTSSNPFGGTAAPSPSPFGMSAPAGNANPSPFGSTQSNAAPVPPAFGNTNAAPAPSPFGNSNAPAAPFGNAAPSPSPFGTAASAPSPFGGASTQNPSPFGGGVAAPAPSPFGMTGAPAPTPFGGAPAPAASPFGSGGMAPAPTPFGSAPAPGPSPFGSATAPAPSPFGSTAPAPAGFGSAQQPSPFGNSGGMAPAASPFGAPTNTTNNSPFGAPSQQNSPFANTGQHNNPFGSSQQSFGQQQNSPFGNAGSVGGRSGGGGRGRGGRGGRGQGGKAPCKFFAQGRCRFGNECRFSHEGGQTNNAFGGGNAFGNAFGGPRR